MSLSCRLLFLLAIFAVADARGATESSASMDALRSLGVQIKQASDRADSGSPASTTSIAQFDRALAAFSAPSAATADSQFNYKLRAIKALFGKLKYQSAHPTQSVAKPAAHARANLDIEVVSDRHGGTCETALGVSASLPVSVTLGQTGKGRNDAWFQFQPQAAGHFQFKTDSHGADPAITAYSSCASGAPVLAANDDTFGLDAAVSISRNDRSTILLHVTNSGIGGPVVMGVAQTNGTISGTVTAAATDTHVANAEVVALDTNGGYTGAFAYSDQNGMYSMSIAPGTYYLRVEFQNSYVPVLYPNAQCEFDYYFQTSDCNIAQAQTITVADGASVSNINFSLSTGQSISGQIRDTSNQPIASASLTLFDGSGNQVTSQQSDGLGHYTFSVLADGIYKVSAQDPAYASQMYRNVSCGGTVQSQCDLTQASPITISGQNAQGIDFALTRFSAIQGSVNGAGGQPVGQYGAQVWIIDIYGDEVAQAPTDSNGNYSAGPLVVGNYYAFATSAGYFPQLFAGIDCGENCLQSIPSATVIAITQLGEDAQANFQLHALPLVTGHVQDAASAAPLANVTVAVSVTPPASFSAVDTATTDSNGDYTLNNVMPGTYYVWAQSNNYIDQLYSGIPCEAGYYYNPYTAYCDVTGATLLTVASGQTPGAINFALNAASSISGNVITNAGPGSDLPANVTVAVYNDAGVVAGQVNTDASGNYVVNDLPPGTYFASTQSYYYQQYIQQVWQQINCLTVCAPTTGTPITVGPSANVADINFFVTALGSVVGRVTNALGAPIGGAVVDLFNAVSDAYVTSGVADAQGYYSAPGNIANSYFAATEAGPGYVDQVYAGISCPVGPAYYGLCPLTNATPLVLSGGNTQPQIANFVLQSNDPIFSNGFETP
jgi:Carboxypeptidase regulatory-like domain